MAYQVGIKLDLDGVKKKMSKDNVQKGQRAWANQAMADMNQYVPAKEFILRNTVTLGLQGETINYNTPYAAWQFRNQFSNYTTPGTGPRWDLKAKGMHMSDWEKAFLSGAGF